MRHINLPFLAGVVLLAAALEPASARPTVDNSYRETIDTAISRFEQTRREAWSYRVERYENEEGDITSSVEQYNPPTQWTLLRLNGSAPSPKAQQAFQAKKQEQSEESNKGANYSLSLRDIIDTNSLTLVDESSRQLRLGFKVKHLKRLGNDATGKLVGTLVFNKQEAFIEHIAITNNDVFSPVFSAKIEQIRLSFSFTHIDDAILPLETTMDMKGSFAFFTEIDETSRDSYSQYHKESK